MGSGAALVEWQRGDGRHLWHRNDPVPGRANPSPHLKASFVTIGGDNKNYIFRNNVYRLSLQRNTAFWWQLLQLQYPNAPAGKEAVRAQLEKAYQDPTEMESWFHHLPLKSFKALDKPFTIVGPVKATLYGLSSARDTDWVVRLCDVWPDGRSMSVCDGILRARYRTSSEREELMAPNQIYRFKVDMWATAQTFLPGHRIRIQVTSGDFPRYDRNLNTGGPFGEEVRWQVAVNTVFHDTLRPSHIVLPVMP